MADSPEGKLHIGPLLGAGGFGEVYRARLRSPGGLLKVVAVKILHHRAGAAEDARNRLRDEGILLARVRHPVVVQPLELLHVEDRLALVTEFVPGRDLQDVLHVGPPLGLRAFLQVMGQVAAGLHAAWNAVDPQDRPLHIIHRDIKPSNIRIGQHGQVRLLDFGIASFTSDDRQAHTASDVVVGSMPYMAPERFTSAQSGPEVDVYGLGCCLFEGLAGAPFHRHAHMREVSRLAIGREAYAAHLEARMALIQPDAEPIREVLVRCLAWDPQARPTSREVAERCQTLADDMAGASLRQWCSRNPWPSVSENPGPLTGRVVHNRDSNSHPSNETHSVQGPRRVEIPIETLEPAMLAGGGVMSHPQDGTPKAPPAFPSIPMGTALEQLNLSEAEAEVVRQAVGTPKPAHSEAPTQIASPVQANDTLGPDAYLDPHAAPRRAPQPLPATPAMVHEELAQQPQSRVPVALVAAGCALALVVATGLLASAAAIGAYVYFQL